jgi:hypothetical protein
MNLFLKQFLIIAFTFLVILWFQNRDDEKQKKVRTTTYDQYKFPVLVGSIVGLILNLQTFLCTTKISDIASEIIIVTPTNDDIKIDLANPLNESKLSWIKDPKKLIKQEVYTDLPDF